MSSKYFYRLDRGYLVLFVVVLAKAVLAVLDLVVNGSLLYQIHWEYFMLKKDEACYGRQARSCF